MPSQPPRFDTARYLISYSHPASTWRISATTLSIREAGISSIQEFRNHHFRNMYPVTGVVGGLRNGFNRYRMAYHEQPYHIDEDRFLGYPNVLLNSDGHQTPTPMSYTPGIPQVAMAPAQDAILNTTVANDERRRRSSAMSPRTIRAPTCQTPYPNSFPLSVRQTITPPSSNNFTSHTTKEQIAAESNFQAFNRPSLSIVSSTVRTSTTSACTETPTATYSQSQRVIFALLSDICTEALRRKWYDETQRQSVRSLNLRHPRSSRHRRRSCGRYSPYAPLYAVPIRHFHTSETTQYTGAATAMTEQPLCFMELMQRIATATWEDATQTQQEQSLANERPPASRPTTSGDLEAAAIDSMRTLYSLGNSVMAATLAIHGETFNLDEIRDIVGVAAGFCRFLGYAEGAERCEEAGRRHFGLYSGQEDHLEGGVL